VLFRSKQFDDTETLERKADLDWINCLVSKVKEKSSNVLFYRRNMTVSILITWYTF